MAILHGLELYFRDDLRSRRSAPKPKFWERALTCAIISNRLRHLEDRRLFSLVLRQVGTVEQVHIEHLLFHWSITPRTLNFDVVESVLRHQSVRNLRLTDETGQTVTLFWFFADVTVDFTDYLSKCLNMLIEVSSTRGEDVRQRCGPDGNLVETLLKQSPSENRKRKLLHVRKYYASNHWPFEYDVDEIDRRR